MLKLDDVTLFLADGRTDEDSFNKSLFAIKHCLSKADFGNVIFQSAFKSDITGVGYKHIKPMNISQYSLYLSSGQVIENIKTKHMLVVQHDGFILNPDKWDPEYLNYDYIGAPWTTAATERPHSRVGNGGFSLRSRKLLEICLERNLGSSDNEDWRICIWHRPLLETLDIKFAPLELAAYFSIETHLPDFDHDLTKRFGFHGPRHFDAINKIYGLTLK